MWDLPTEGTYRFSPNREKYDLIDKYLYSKIIEDIERACVEYVEYRKTSYTSEITNPNSLGIELLRKFSPEILEFSETSEEFHNGLVEMYQCIVVHYADRMIRCGY